MALIHLTRLVLTDFRSYFEALIAPGPGFVVLTGENGAGKTNVLEAVSLLAPRTGPARGGAVGDGTRRGAGGLRRRGTAGGRGGDRHRHPRHRARAAAGADQRRGHLGRGAGRAAGGAVADAGDGPAVRRGGRGGRRRFLDRLVLAREPAHAVHANRYEAAMRARNKLLAEPEGADAAWLAALETGMAEHGAAIAAARIRTVDALAEALRDQPAGPFARAGLAITGWLPGDGDTLPAELKAGRGRDAAAGRTLAGPHRSDLAVTHLDKRHAAELCSTGEQKALLLGIVLAHAGIVGRDRGAAPVLLLDEVAAHLDPRRRAALFERLEGTGGQVWMTGTEPALFDGIGAGASLFHVADGQVR